MGLKDMFTMYLAEKPIYQAVYMTLRNAIITGQIAKGEHISEAYLVKLFNISRTPIRRAIRTLESNGLIENITDQGPVAVGISMESLTNLFQLQQALERLAFPLTIQNITDEEIQELEEKLAFCEENLDVDILKTAYVNEEVHRKLFLVSGFEGISEAVDLAYGLVQGFNLIASNDRVRQMSNTAEHKAMIKAIKARDLVLLQSVSDYHLEACKLYAIQCYNRTLLNFNSDNHLGGIEI